MEVLIEHLQIENKIGEDNFDTFCNKIIPFTCAWAVYGICMRKPNYLYHFWKSHIH